MIIIIQVQSALKTVEMESCLVTTNVMMEILLVAMDAQIIAKLKELIRVHYQDIMELRHVLKLVEMQEGFMRLVMMEIL